MLLLKEYKKIVKLLVLGYGLLISQSAYGQCYLTASDMVLGPPPTYGEQLHNLGVDTTQIDAVFQALREGILLKSQYAALFLAEHNKEDAIELIKNKYNKEREYTHGAFRYLKALKMLKDNSAESMLIAFADSLYRVIKAGKAHDTEHYVYQGTLQLLMDFNNYSQFERIIEIIKSNAKAKDSQGYYSLLLNFLGVDKFKDEVINTFIFILNNYSNTSSRVSVANRSCLFPESTKLQNALRKSAVEDTSFAVRKWSLIRLQDTYQDPNLLDLVLANLEAINTRPNIELYLFIIYEEYNPRSLFLIKKLKNSSSNKIVQEEAANIYKDYWWLYFKPFGKEYNYTPSRTLDSLKAYTKDVASYDWLGDQGFVNELTNRLENAQRHLARGDSANAAKQIVGFRQRLQKVYEQSQQRNNNPRFVTEDGYKFLYYNAGYLLERLPDHPSEQEKQRG
ncbi:MAG TPA: hypothetical protein VF181_04190 [Balneolaceae bacterium]